MDHVVVPILCQMFHKRRATLHALKQGLGATKHVPNTTRGVRGGPRTGAQGQAAPKAHAAPAPRQREASTRNCELHRPYCGLLNLKAVR